MILVANGKKVKDQADIEVLVFRLETKLKAEQIVVAFTKAEKEAKLLIDKAKEKAGWTNWISSSVWNVIGYGSTPLEEGKDNTEEELNSIMKKLQEFDQSETSSVHE